MVSSSLQVKMIMTQLVPDDSTHHLHSQLLQMPRADLDPVILKKIPATGGSQPGIETGLMGERFSKVLQRECFHPTLQGVIIPRPYMNPGG